MNILEINSLTKSFDILKSLDNLSLSIPKGIILGLVGSNGAGKSTTINCITNLLNPDSGVIKIFGKILKEDEINIKIRMGVLYENTDDLFLYLKGEEHLHFVGNVYGINKKILEMRIDELFAYFELESHRHILIESYSRGMKKKIAFASILLHDPEFIILDEPFEGLDIMAIIKVKKILRQLKEKGKTILITSHIFSYIEDLSDEVAIINKGKIIFQSATKEIRNKIKNELTKETYQSLEDIFLDLATDKKKIEQPLSWI